MIIVQYNHQKIIVSLIFVWIFIALLSSFQVSAKSRHPISDNQIRAKKNQCYEDIDSGLWGERCMSSKIAKENCALQCVSPICYQLIYESDPKFYCRESLLRKMCLCNRDCAVECPSTFCLEEGEKDYIRGQEYKYCLHKDSLGESLEGVKGSYAVLAE